MNSRLREPRIWMTQKGYRGLWYLCTSVGLVSAVFLAPLHWTFLVSTIVIAWGGPLIIEFAWDGNIAHRRVADKTSTQIDSKPSGRSTVFKQRRWFTEEHVFHSGTGTLWLATLIALMEPESSLLFLILGFSFTLTLYCIKHTVQLFGNTAQ